MKPSPYAFLLLLALLSACTGAPRYANEPRLRRQDVSANRTRVEPKVVERCSRNPDGDVNCRSESIFIGVAISGGGSRAANFSAAVLSELDAIGLLRHVNAISSVSGGSLTAAYLAKNWEQVSYSSDFWGKAKRDLSQDFRSAFVRKTFRPDNFMASMFGSLGRTELMAKVFDDMVFQGAKFRDLGPSGFSLLMNATAINNIYGVEHLDRCTNRQGNATSMRWESVPFSSDFFNQCLHSTLDSYPISRAVSASAAFPGVYSSVPLGVFDPVDSNKADPSMPGQFLHLIDGGPSDNLGIEGLMGPLLTKMGELKRPTDRCMIVVIDAFGSGDIDRRHRKDDIRSAADRIVDSNFMDSIDAMLYRRREDTLRTLGILFPSMNSSPPVYSGNHFPVEEGYYDYHGTARISSVSIRQNRDGTFVFLPTTQPASSRPPELAAELECLIWYIGLDSLRELVITDWEHFERREIKALSPDTTIKGNTAYKGLSDSTIQASLNAYLRTDRPRRINDAWELATRVRTDFDLVGPPRCPSRVLADALWITGKTSVNADVTSRKTICKWLDETRLSRSMRCDSHEKADIPKLPVKYATSDKWFEYSIECD